MLAVDFLILNRDRHGANIEVLRNARARTLRIAPLFDHGLSLLYSCLSEEDTLPAVYFERIWDMIYTRYRIYEEL